MKKNTVIIFLLLMFGSCMAQKVPSKRNSLFGVQLNKKGISLSSNTHVMTDLATYYIQQFYVTIQMPENDIIKDPKAQARQFMDSAIHYLNKSYKLDPKDVNTVYKLSICYWNVENCSNAWKYYDEAVALGGRPITEEYTKDLKKRCKRD